MRPAVVRPRIAFHMAVLLLAVAALAPSARALAAPARALAPPRLAARAAILVDVRTGQVLYSSAANRQLAIASATKLMTALVTLARVPDRRTIFTQNDYRPAAVDSQIGLQPGERMTVRDLLLAMLLPSADDAAEDLAYNVGHGSVSRFIAMMNARAAQLKLAHTHYASPSGLDTPGNYSSASDLAALARYLLTHQPFFARAVALPAVTLETGPVRRVTNRNDLVGRVPWINGVKTGHTLQAGYVLVGSGTRNGMTLISVVLDTPTQQARDADTLALLRYGFANFHVVTPVRAGAVLARPSVRYRAGEHALVIAASTFSGIFARATRITTRVDVPRQLAGPLPKDAVVGTATVLADNRPIVRIPLLLARALPAVSSLSRAASFLTRPFTLLMLVLLVGTAVATSVFRRQKTRARAAAASR